MYINSTFDRVPQDLSKCVFWMNLGPFVFRLWYFNSMIHLLQDGWGGLRYACGGPVVRDVCCTLFVGHVGTYSFQSIRCFWDNDFLSCPQKIQDLHEIELIVCFKFHFSIDNLGSISTYIFLKNISSDCVKTNSFKQAQKEPWETLGAKATPRHLKSFKYLRGRGHFGAISKRPITHFPYQGRIKWGSNNGPKK